MLVKKLLATAALFAASLLAQEGISRAQAPAAAPVTLWSFLGLQRGALNSALFNRQGNFPGSELKPPLKSIADPANLQSKNPGIKKAAEVKAEEDLAQQKIKALKYLAEVGCGCYPGVGEALLAALDDCTEAVRYEATQAIIKASGAPRTHCDKYLEKKIKGHHDACHDAVIQACKCCKKTLHGLCGTRDAQGRNLHEQIHDKLDEHHGGGSGCKMCACGGCADSCCSDDIIAKLKDMAYGTTENGCPKEPSERVRGMAAQALRACPGKPEPITVPTPEKEVPTPAPPKELPIPTPPSASVDLDPRLRAATVGPKPRDVVRTDATAQADSKQPSAPNVRTTALQNRAVVPAQPDAKLKAQSNATSPKVAANAVSALPVTVVRQKLRYPEQTDPRSAIDAPRAAVIPRELRYPDSSVGFARGAEPAANDQNSDGPAPTVSGASAARAGVGSASRAAAQAPVGQAVWVSDSQ